MATSSAEVEEPRPAAIDDLNAVWMLRVNWDAWRARVISICTRISPMMVGVAVGEVGAAVGEAVGAVGACVGEAGAVGAAVGGVGEGVGLVGTGVGGGVGGGVGSSGVMGD